MIQLSRFKIADNLIMPSAMRRGCNGRCGKQCCIHSYEISLANVQTIVQRQREIAPLLLPSVRANHRWFSTRDGILIDENWIDRPAYIKMCVEARTDVVGGYGCVFLTRGGRCALRQIEIQNNELCGTLAPLWCMVYPIVLREQATVIDLANMQDRADNLDAGLVEKCYTRNGPIVQPYKLFEHELTLLLGADQYRELDAQAHALD